ncbi:MULTISPECIES: hypothetical protein [unclassified Natrinema]|uniref:Uncharacterized protein n=1 Tax=Saline Natrinema sp. J7-1 virus 2 TaxID=2847286 RepID=A0A976XG30_9VIRU|nr:MULTISPECIES: hypothetical protein [unclassified Natrinema]YP_010772545.1 hypothetical protein QIT43_gp22 [Saline Natrinema sp. J7-1 virus 2]AFO55972.1 hypothetical protein NJ7G_0716 [Natrinema sp. J7-2]UUT36793.1 hypothetical protein SNJ2_gp22 [Saline Natrinema sp. J7-1 virus 2]
MSSRASELESPKASGDALEGEIIQAVDALEYVSDHTATWHDARTTAVLEASHSLPFYGIVLVEPDVPVEIKGCQIETSNGDRSTRGRFYVKRAAHDQLLEAGGMYLFVVYLPRPGLPQVARAVVPATLVDELLAGRWYEVGGSRSESEVAKLAWSHVIDPAGVDSSVTVGDRA